MTAVCFKYSFVLLLLLSPCLGAGQQAIRQALLHVDSLLHIEDMDKADSLLRSIEKNPPKDAADLLRLQYLRGYYYNALEDNIKATKLLLNLPEKSERKNLYKLSAEANIQMALVHEKTDNLIACKAYLDKASSIINKNRFDTLLGWLYVRTSSYYRFKDNLDSALYFARAAIPAAEKYKHKHALADAYLLVAIYLVKRGDSSALSYFKMALQKYLLQYNYRGAATMYGNISKIYLKKNLLNEALLYNDSGVSLAVGNNLPDTYMYWEIRSNIFNQKKQFDSALYYYKKYTEGLIEVTARNEAREIKKLTEQYEGDKKEATIKAQQKRLTAIIIISSIIALASLALYIQYRKIKKQNSRIIAQVNELNRLVKQKQILLSELQHRVKNNLQHVLSLLDIQKESLAHNNIEEAIRENKNRVHSMAMLHNKLWLADGNDAVDFEGYLHELAALIHSAYYDPQKEIEIEVKGTIKELNIDTAVPLGLVMVELLSNSLKHAFKYKKNGTIRIEITNEIQIAKRLLTYSDDGCGFDFKHPPKKGLGLELINGLLKEINATLQSKHDNGTTFFIRF